MSEVTRISNMEQCQWEDNEWHFNSYNCIHSANSCEKSGWRNYNWNNCNNWKWNYNRKFYNYRGNYYWNNSSTNNNVRNKSLFLSLLKKCFSTSTQTTEEVTTTTQETTTEQPTTIITTTEHDIPKSYEGRTIILSNTKMQTLFHPGTIPLWIILLISICMVILTILAICVFLKRFYPDVWNSLKRRCPQLNRHNNYQVSPLNSCKSKFGLITRCFPSCPETLKFKWFQRGKTDPSRDTCFLCLKKVI